jgi:hypothetical protein
MAWVADGRTLGLGVVVALEATIDEQRPHFLLGEVVAGRRGIGGRRDARGQKEERQGGGSHHCGGTSQSRREGQAARIIVTPGTCAVNEKREMARAKLDERQRRGTILLPAIP